MMKAESKLKSLQRSFADKKQEVKAMKKYVCSVCGWVYDEEKGMPDAQIPAGTKFEDLPADFSCPLCSVGKEMFTEE